MNQTLLTPIETSSSLLVPSPAPDQERLQALLVHDEEDVREHMRWLLLHEAWDVSAFSTASDAVSRIQQGLRPDVLFVNAQLRSVDQTSALAWLRRATPTTPAIAVSCCHDPRSIVEAIRTGATDVLVHPFDRADLKTSLKRCFDAAGVKKRGQVREIPLGQSVSFVFSSDRMRAIASQCELIARTDLPVLILGESGTGKEILAQYIHRMSACAKAPILKVNCAAMPGDLLESELFGYEQGAFTGAVKAKPGKFELCNGGTIFLDEIGEMPPALQAKLLQVLQDGTFSRLGGRSTIKVDVRVISATNIDIKAAMKEQHFREDLYYRINGFSIALPPLRQRREEIPVLIRYFMQRTAEKYAHRPVNMSPEVMSVCMGYDWPGNLRELENFVKRYLVLGDDQMMISELAPACSQALTTTAVASNCTPPDGLKKMLSSVKGEAEAAVISAALQRNHWRRKKTAAELKISYKALLYKMRQHNIVAPDTGASYEHVVNSPKAIPAPDAWNEGYSL